MFQNINVQDNNINQEVETMYNIESSYEAMIEGMPANFTETEIDSFGEVAKDTSRQEESYEELVKQTNKLAKLVSERLELSNKNVTIHNWLEKHTDAPANVRARGFKAMKDNKAAKEKIELEMELIKEACPKAWPCYYNYLDGDKARSIELSAWEMTYNPQTELGYVGEAEILDRGNVDDEFQAYLRGQDGEEDGPERKLPFFGFSRFKDYQSNRDEWFGHSLAQWDLAKYLRDLRAAYVAYKKRPYSAHVLAYLAYLGKDAKVCLEETRKTLALMRYKGQVYRLPTRK